MIRNGPPYIDCKEVDINGTTQVDCRKELQTGKHMSAQAFTVVTAWTHATEFLKLTPAGGSEVSLSRLGSVALAAGTTYQQSLNYFRGSGTNETGFKIIAHY